MEKVKMIKYPKIGQFKDTFRKVRSKSDFKGMAEDGITPIYEHTEPYPIVNFQGTVKLHGSNGGIVFKENGAVVQSRNRVLTLQSDNAGFCHFVHALPKEVLKIIAFKDSVVYSEWCGGSIQKGVALNQLDKMMVIYSVKDITDPENTRWVNSLLDGITDEELELLNYHQIFLISQFPMFDIAIDFNSPELAQNKLVELTKAVGDECPVAKCFDVSGTGEGIVWKCTTAGYESSAFWFKVKDDRHSTSKVKKLANVDPVKVKSIDEFVNNNVTSPRLNQGIEYFKEMGIEFEKCKTGEFIKWVKNDILAEDFDSLVASGLTMADVGGGISRRCSQFYLKYVELR